MAKLQVECFNSESDCVDVFSRTRVKLCPTERINTVINWHKGIASVKIVNIISTW